MRSVFPSDFCLEPPPRSISYNPLYRPDLSPLVSSPSSTSTNSSFSFFSSCQPSSTSVSSSTSQHSNIMYHQNAFQDRSASKHPSAKMQTRSFSHIPTPPVPASQQHRISSGLQRRSSSNLLIQIPSQAFNNSSGSCNLKLSMALVPQHSYREFKNICLFCKSNKENYRCYSSHTLKNENGDITCPILFKYVCPTCQATGKYAHTKAYCPLNPHKPFRPWTRCNPTGHPVYIGDRIKLYK